MFGLDEPVQQQSQTNESVNQGLAILQEEVQNLRDEMSKRKRGKGKNTILLLIHRGVHPLKNLTPVMQQKGN